MKKVNLVRTACSPSAKPSFAAGAGLAEVRFCRVNERNVGRLPTEGENDRLSGLSGLPEAGTGKKVKDFRTGRLLATGVRSPATLPGKR